MDKAAIANIIERVRNTWESITLIVSLIATAVLYFMPTFFPNLQVDPIWMFSSAYMGIISMVFILLEMRTAVATQTENISYLSLKEAEPDILNKIISVSKKRRNDPIDIRIWANRLSRVSIVLLDIFRMSNDGKFGQNKLNIVVYHTDPDLIPAAYIPGPRDAKTEDKHRTYLESLTSNINWVKKSADEASNITIKFLKCNQIPYFYTYLIDWNYLFWGYFMWNDDVKDWIGPSNKCHYVESGHDSLLIIDWIKNRLKIMDGLYDNSDLPPIENVNSSNLTQQKI